MLTPQKKGGVKNSAHLSHRFDLHALFLFRVMLSIYVRSLWPFSVPSSLWRVKAGFHTLPQVSVGAAVGTVDAVLWYHFCQVYFSSRVRLIVSLRTEGKHSVGGGAKEIGSRVV